MVYNRTWRSRRRSKNSFYLKKYMKLSTNVWIGSKRANRLALHIGGVSLLNFFFWTAGFTVWFLADNVVVFKECSVLRSFYSFIMRITPVTFLWLISKQTLKDPSWSAHIQVVLTEFQRGAYLWYSISACFDSVLTNLSI